MVAAMSENSNQLSTTPLLQSPSASTASSTGLPFDEEAKLVYGVVISLRNVIKKMSGRYVIFSIQHRDDTIQNRTPETSNLSITAPRDTSFTYLKPCQVTNL
jgi:trafficking protein particle complex subunit 1